MTIQSKDQRFANAVFPNVREAAAKEDKDKYKTLCKKAGALVRNSGLMQTLAFFKARNEAHHQAFYDHLESELRQLGVLPCNDTGLFDQVRAASVPEYMVLTREVLHLMNWHKRLADTLIAGD